MRRMKNKQRKKQNRNIKEKKNEQYKAKEKKMLGTAAPSVEFMRTQTIEHLLMRVFLRHYYGVPSVQHLAFHARMKLRGRIILPTIGLAHPPTQEQQLPNCARIRLSFFNIDFDFATQKLLPTTLEDCLAKANAHTRELKTNLRGSLHEFLGTHIKIKASLRTA